MEVQESLEVQGTLETQEVLEEQELIAEELTEGSVNGGTGVEVTESESSMEQEEERQEVEIEEYLSENVPELQEYGEYIKKKSNQQADLTIRIYMDLETIRQNEEKKYYAVYVGESWEDHTVNWDWFYVREDLEEILWYSVIDDIYLSLEEWRESEYYNNYNKNRTDPKNKTQIRKGWSEDGTVVCCGEED